MAADRNEDVMAGLDGRTALVTGAGRNIGRATALALAADGADVVVHARRRREEANGVVAEVEALGRRAHAVIGDLGDASEVETIIARTLEVFETVDILVANAAIRPHKPFAEVDDEFLRYVMAVNFESTVRLVRAFSTAMRANGWGRIITTVGLNSMSGQAERSIVSAAKMATLGLTRSLSKEFAPDGVTVNCISPGHIETTQADGSVKELPTTRQARIPVGRPGRPEDIAAMCAFLASDDASFVSGQTLGVNGGESST